MRMVMDTEMEQCISNCMQCYRICEETNAQCRQGGRSMDPDHQLLLADCARICLTSADFMIRGSPRHSQTCSLCATICDECAIQCERMGRQNAHMAQCADICRRCAKTCHAMATQMI